MQKDKIKKIIKFEKVLKKFCRDIGFDQKTLLGMLLGGQSDPMSCRKDYQSNSKESINAMIGRESEPINTGIAAQ